MKKNYSLSSLLLVTTIVCLLLTFIILQQRSTYLQHELAQYRQRFGELGPISPGRVSLTRLSSQVDILGPGGDPTPPEEIGRYRISVPWGYRALLRLGESTFPNSEPRSNPPPTESASLNEWCFGADDVITYLVTTDLDGTPRIVVFDEKQTLIDYRMKDWPDTSSLMEVSHLETSETTSFMTSETISLTLWRDPATNRGVMLWLEPVTASKR
jgi:hypothetical protein